MPRYECEITVIHHGIDHHKSILEFSVNTNNFSSALELAIARAERTFIPERHSIWASRITETER